MKKLVLLFTALSISFFSHSLNAAQAIVSKSAPIYSKDSYGRYQKIGTVQPGDQVEVLGRSKNGKMLKVQFENTIALISSSAVKGFSRKTASIHDNVTLGYRKYQFAINGGMALQSASYGVGFGAGGFYKIDVFEKGSLLTLDLGPSFYLFPSAGLGLTAFEVLGTGRLKYSFLPNMEIGGELGVAYINISGSINDPTLAAVGINTSISGSSLGFVLGGIYTWEFAKQFHLLSGLRIIAADGSAIALHGGLEYRF